MSDTELQYGLIGEELHESDRVMGGVVDWSMVANPPSRRTDKKIMYDQRQDKERPNGCTLFSSMLAYTSNFGYIFSNAEKAEIYDDAVELGLDPSIGWSVPKAVDLIRRRMGDVSSARVAVGSDDYFKALLMGFTLITGYGGNRVYNQDRDNNGILEINQRGKATYHHAIPHAVIDDKGTQGVIDSAALTRPKTNVYANPDIVKKVDESGNYFSRAYFYFKKITMDTTNLPKHITRDDVLTPAQQQAVIAWENEASKHITNGGKLLYSDYWTDNVADHPLILAKMMDDLARIRGK